MHEDIVQIYKEQQAIGYPSTLVEGEEECRRYMKNLFHDWRPTSRKVMCSGTQLGVRRRSEL
jgi:hypothetical protein